MQLAAMAAPSPHYWPLPPLAGRGVSNDMYALPAGTLWARNRRSDAASAKVRLAHVDQGYLNSCFLAAVMGALALRQPTRLERMVVDRTTHVEVRLPTGTVDVGKELPLERGRPIYAGSGGNAVLWPSYLEKAIASRHRDGYRWLDRGGDMREAFAWLTGMHPEEASVPPRGGLLDDLRSRIRAGEAVVVGTWDSSKASHRGRELARLGLHANHAYVVQSVFSRAGESFLRLWNIWGYDHPQVLTEHQARRLISEVVTDASWYFMPDTPRG